jgi:hypothetical protein
LLLWLLCRGTWTSCLASRCNVEIDNGTHRECMRKCAHITEPSGESSTPPKLGQKGLAWLKREQVYCFLFLDTCLYLSTGYSTIIWFMYLMCHDQSGLLAFPASQTFFIPTCL